MKLSKNIFKKANGEILVIIDGCNKDHQLAYEEALTYLNFYKDVYSDKVDFTYYDIKLIYCKEIDDDCSWELVIKLISKQVSNKDEKDDGDITDVEW